MVVTGDVVAEDDTGSFRHEAFLYRDHSEFMAGAAAFMLEAVAAEEPMLIVVDSLKIQALRSLLPERDHQVEFADMATVGRNPARIIPAWRRFVDEHAEPGRRLRGIGEPIWAGRGPAELVECRHHEALLNLAFEETPRFWLLCPYNAATLDPTVVVEAHTTHPFVHHNGPGQASPDYHGVDPAALFGEPLPEPPLSRQELVFSSLRAVRRFVAVQAAAAGLDPATTADVVLAVDEVATNSLRHGGGVGRLSLWRDGDALVCELWDEGSFTDPLIGRRRPSEDQHHGRGLWMVNQLCDLLQLRNNADGTTARLHFRTGRD